MEYKQFVEAFRQVSIYGNNILEFRPHPLPHRSVHVFQRPSSFTHQGTYCDLSVSLGQFSSIPVCVMEADLMELSRERRSSLTIFPALVAHCRGLGPDISYCH